MPYPKGGSKGKSKGKKNKCVDAVDRSGFRMKFNFLFSCLYKAKDSPGNGSPDDNERHQQVTPISSTSSNSVIVVRSIPNQSPKQGAYPHLRNFSYNDLRLATRNFKREHFLGEGGFGRVFKGWLSKDAMTPTRPGIGMPVAVKTLNQDGLQGHREWLAEVNYLGQVQHPNLVRLIGFCNEGDKRLLVYEFMPGGSLESHLFRRSLPFPWSMRMKIMLDAAKGLAYLHQDDNKNAVIFRDFKTSNVLLDRDFNAKLSDFGLAKDGPQGDRSHVSTRVMGTRGYAAPEYVVTGRLSAKSDVYSFGVVLLEMVTGKKATDRLRPPGETNLVQWAVPLIRDGGRYCHMVLVDPRLQGRYPVKGALKALRLAAQCVRNNPSLRPPMSEVVSVMMTLPDMVDDDNVAPQVPSLSRVMQVGPSNSNLGGANKFGLAVGSSSRSVPSRFQASPCNLNHQALPTPKPRPNGGRRP